MIKYCLLSTSNGGERIRHVINMCELQWESDKLQILYLKIQGCLKLLYVEAGKQHTRKPHNLKSYRNLDNI